jgi:hypothetical protein
MCERVDPDSRGRERTASVAASPDSTASPAAHEGSGRDRKEHHRDERDLDDDQTVVVDVRPDVQDRIEQRQVEDDGRGGPAPGQKTPPVGVSKPKMDGSA